ncbi:MAG: GH3 auxin-responsive promoter family protein [Oligoflexia bacterium]|nr:GH3 auxin-responsive promoter family protein [Oligoflexia bacterium]
MAFTTKIVQSLTYFPYRSFVRDCKNPVAAKARLWAEISLLINKGDFWKTPHKNLDQFPISDYEDYRQTIETAYKNSNICPITGEPILFWSESGGTTGKSKKYPITEIYKKSFQSTTPPLLHSFCKRFPKFLQKPVLYFASTLPEKISPQGIELGFISGYNYRNIPPLLAKKYAFPIEVFKDRETFFRWGPLYALCTDLSAMIAITPSIIEQFATEIEKNKNLYLRCLKNDKEVPAHLPKIHCSLERQKLLEHELSITPIDFSRIWPSLSFICCWKSATCGLQLPRINKWVKKIPIIDATYSATEAWMTVPMETEQIGGPFHPNALILEFFHSDKPEKILQAWELAIGEQYEVLLTTKMGFIRYRLYDIVRCNGYFHKSPILEFVEKAGNTVSLGQCRISETHILASLGSLDFSNSWLIAPAVDGSGLVFYIETTEDQLEKKVALLDLQLQKNNSDYAEDIRDGLLKPIRIKVHSDYFKNFETHAQNKPKVIQKNPIETI